ncbi:hypothetical protein jhhlp_008778 [Lomentospora prolificans]|uniref:Glucose-methanol-choline oxidoreductase C-terminal domain-containing protein n=1 Tax=Lomentospora prolificans TaxID=41688 RepID=A0A2N3MZ08_9PEZI|nr:hypothetical protein jhhlp_008778 [Lomentospora prolificans]
MPVAEHKPAINITLQLFTFSLTPLTMHIRALHQTAPSGAGTVNINGPSLASEPVVDYRTCSNPVDIDITIEMMRFHRRVNLESPILTPFDLVEVGPGIEVTSRLAKDLANTSGHIPFAAQCTPLAPGGVVDEQLRVYGVEGLRVVDASVMIIIVGSNICGPVYAIAE